MDSNEYDVVLSFAGEDRKYVENVATALQSQGVKVFYDRFEEIDLWGKDLYVHLDDVYRNKGRYCVMFISRYYAQKLWTNHERESAQARAFEENEEYLLPARFDDTEILGIRQTIGYVDLKKYSPEDFASLILGKLGFATSEKKSDQPNYRQPKLGRKSFNPYDESFKFMNYVEDELKRRIDGLADETVSVSVFDRDGWRLFRVVLDGETKYSFGMRLGGMGSDSSISFQGTIGKSRSGPNSYSAWGEIKWNDDSNSPALELHDLSLFGLLSTQGDLITFEDFLGKLWEVICDALER